MSDREDRNARKFVEDFPESLAEQLALLEDSLRLNRQRLCDLFRISRETEGGSPDFWNIVAEQRAEIATWVVDQLRALLLECDYDEEEAANAIATTTAEQFPIGIEILQPGARMTRWEEDAALFALMMTHDFSWARRALLRFLAENR